MAKKKHYEFREKNHERGDGLKQRRLKDEARWKYNPNSANTDLEFEDYENEEEDWREYEERLR